jgi:transcriptional regulator with XRE-family HTH domain
MRESLENLREQFEDEEFRYGYAEAFLNSYIAAQIKIIREEREMTQAQLAEKIGTKQAGISRLENVNHAAWKVETLTRLARALGVRLRISFEEFGTLPDEIEFFGPESLKRRTYTEDPVFHPQEGDVPFTEISKGLREALQGKAESSTVRSIDALARIEDKNETDVNIASKSLSVYRGGGTEPGKPCFPAGISSVPRRDMQVPEVALGA